MEITRIQEKDEEIGLDPDLILDEFKLYSEEFICLICSNLAFDPITCNKCHCFFCKNCIVKWLQTSLTCPNRCKFVEEPFNRKLSILLNKIKLRCGYFKKGCNRIVTYESYKFHYQSCEFGLYKCANTKCKFSDKRENVEEHVKNCPFKMIFCKFCKSKMENRIYQEHQETCGNSESKCNFCELEIMVKEIETHQQTCEKFGPECQICKKSIQKDIFHTRELCVENIKVELNKAYEKEREEFKDQIKTLKKKEQYLQNNYNEIVCMNKEYANKEKNALLSLKKVKASLNNLQVDYNKIVKENSELKNIIIQIKKDTENSKISLEQRKEKLENDQVMMKKLDKTLVIEKNLLFEENNSFDNNFPIINTNNFNNYDEMLNSRIVSPFPNMTKSNNFNIITNPVIKKNHSKEQDTSQEYNRDADVNPNKSPQKVNLIGKSKPSNINSTLVTIISEHRLEVKIILYLKDKELLLSTSDDCSVFLWSVPSFTISQKIDKLGPIYSVVYIMNKGSLVFALQDNNIMIYELRSGNRIFLPKKHTMKVIYLLFVKEKNLLFSASADKNIIVWENNDCLKVMTGHIQSVFSLCGISVERSLIASGSMDNTIRIWDYSTGSGLVSLNGHGKAVKVIRYIKTKKILISGSDDRTIRLWDLNDINKVSCIKIIKIHTYAVNDLIFWKKYELIVSCSVDKTIQLTTLKGENVCGFVGHKKSIESISIIKNWDVVNLASASADKTIKLWKLDL